jgi:hypothetical protein
MVVKDRSSGAEPSIGTGRGIPAETPRNHRRQSSIMSLPSLSDFDEMVMSCVTILARTNCAQ